jgi:hypothetical protein
MTRFCEKRSNAQRRRAPQAATAAAAVGWHARLLTLQTLHELTLLGYVPVAQPPRNSAICHPAAVGVVG